jgi:putative hydrolase of the HAD superfamily
MPPIEAITFDVGGTLIEPWPSVGHVYAEVASQHGLGNIPPELLNSRFKEAWSATRIFDHSRSAWASLVTRTFAPFCPAEQSRGFFPELYNRFAQPDAWRLFEDTLPTLEGLARQQIRLGIVSNWDERLRGLLKALDLSRWFETVVISCEVGASKPAPEIFAAAASQLNLPPSRILHVGDSLEADVAGAQGSGFRARRIRRNRPPERDRDISRLTDLLPVIGKPGAKSDKGL